MPKQPFKVRRQDGKLCFFGTSKAYVTDKTNLIAQYTKNVDPNASLQDITVSDVANDSTMLTKKGFSHYAVIDGILPRVVRALYGKHDMNLIFGNCHRAALVASGIFPGMTVTEFKVKPDMKENVTFANLLPGDVVYLKTYFYNHQFSHSFVFLDNDVCLSTNGAFKPFKFHSTAYVVQIYQQQSLADAIRFYRKIKDNNYPEIVITALVDYYQLIDNNYAARRRSPQSVITATKLLQACHEANNNRNLSAAFKSALDDLYKLITQDMDLEEKHQRYLNELEFIHQLSAKNYTFTLNRNTNSTLLIDLLGTSDGLMQRVLNSLALLKNLKIWLDLNKLNNDVLLTLDDDECRLTISSQTSQTIDAILQWLVQLTDTLTHQPMRSQQRKSPLFFTQTPQKESIDSEEENSIECHLQ